MEEENGPASLDPIVVVGQWRQGEGRLPLPFAQVVATAGGQVRIASAFTLPPSDELPRGVEVVDNLEPEDTSVMDDAIGLVLPGGGDIDPASYGRPRHPRTHNVNNRRDRFELSLLAVALERDMPVLAICHGMQILNVSLGGTLNQHLADDPGRLDHDRDNPAPTPQHSVRIKERSSLAQILETTSTGVNSHHHQGIDDLGSGLEEVAWADDGVLEAVSSRTHSWVVGVQWHPEVMAPENPVQQKLFNALVEAAARYQPTARAGARESA
ncbi:MAG: gamma-glutamyl-gamma-aminobutyrate hydrolase family protein [Actinomycetota bacterium]